MSTLTCPICGMAFTYGYANGNLVHQRNCRCPNIPTVLSDSVLLTDGQATSVLARMGGWAEPNEEEKIVEDRNRYKQALESIIEFYRPSAPDMSGKSREPNCFPRPGRIAFDALYPPASISR